MTITLTFGSSLLAQRFAEAVRRQAVPDVELSAHYTIGHCEVELRNNRPLRHDEAEADWLAATLCGMLAAAQAEQNGRECGVEIDLQAAHRESMTPDWAYPCTHDRRDLDYEDEAARALGGWR